MLAKKLVVNGVMMFLFLLGKKEKFLKRKKDESCLWIDA